MQKQRNSQQGTQSEVSSLSIADREYQIANWLLDGEVRQFSKGTIGNRKRATEKLVWFLEQREFERCSAVELRGFVVYLNNAREKVGGRWDDARCGAKPLRPGYRRLPSGRKFAWQPTL